MGDLTGSFTGVDEKLWTMLLKNRLDHSILNIH